MERNSYTGWPIVTTKTEMLLVGYIARSELKQALRISKKNLLVHENTACYFTTNVDTEEAYVDLRLWLDENFTVFIHVCVPLILGVHRHVVVIALPPA